MARLRTVVGLIALAAAVVALVPAQALAVDPETEVGGSGSKWYSGSLLQQSGNNCSVLGNPYSETMVSAIAAYGGAPNQQVVHVGDRYYANVLISIPGNPCGSGSSVVGTDLVLPRGTSVDTSAPIRCFGQPRNASTFGELTGGSWSFMGSSGPYCPSQVGGSLTGTSGAVGVGYRPLANGQLFQLFVPIKSTETLQGAGHSPADEVRWVLSSSGTYDNQGATYVWANVFAANSGNTPFIYFARNPSVVPFWDSAASSGQENKAEWFANLYSAGIPGTFCWELHDGSTATDPNPATCTNFGGTWNGTVTNASDSWQVFGNGPNGGFVPFAYTTPNFTYTIRWTFTYNPGGGNQTVFKDITFTTLAGPDGDGDGVPDASDSCPSVNGTQANGCQPAVQSDPDGDGVFGSADKCPGQNGGSSPDGCPPATATLPTTASGPGPGSGSTLGPGGPTAVATASGLGMSPTTFPAAPSGASIARRNGTTVRYRLSTAARVRFTVEKPAAGRRVGRRCVAPTRSNRRRPRCKRYVTLPGSFNHNGRAGQNSFRFTGRLRARKLRPGGYRLVATPLGANGRSGRAVRTSFRIIP